MVNIIDKIRELVQAQPFYSKVLSGNVFGQCREFSFLLKEELRKAEDVLPGLSVLMVDNQWFTDHGWLEIHHPDIGFMMIDATAGQFLHKLDAEKNYMAYKNVFIGTREQLRQLAAEYKAADSEIIWSPAIIIHPSEQHSSNRHKLEAAFEKVWKHHPLTIDRQLLRNPIEVMARLAARFIDAGLDWSRVSSEELEKLGLHSKQIDEYKRQIDLAEPLISQYSRNACVNR